MDRVVVIGNSGSGKTTVARAISASLGLPYLEMDSVRHRDGWDSVGEDEFSEVVGRFASFDRWVVDGNYTSLGTRRAVWPRADTIVWLDLSRWRVVIRVVRRTLGRLARRERLWGSVLEPLSNLYSLDPHQNIIVWAWTRHARTRAMHESALTSGAWSHATVQRLRTPSEVRRFLASLERTSPRRN